MMNSKPLLLTLALLMVLSCGGARGDDVPGDLGGDTTVDAVDVILEVPSVEVDVSFPDTSVDPDINSDAYIFEMLEDVGKPDDGGHDAMADVQADVDAVTDMYEAFEDAETRDDGGFDARADIQADIQADVDITDACECVDDGDCLDVFPDTGACDELICTACVCERFCDANCTVDTDGDLTTDCLDGCPKDPSKTEPGVCGCGVADIDTDNDGVRDCVDLCPLDPMKYLPGACGCGVEDVNVDSDGDGWWDCIDQCPGAETDGDSDGFHAPCNDACDDDPARQTAVCGGCAVPDTDADSDGVPWCNDVCDNNPGIQTNLHLPGCAAGAEDCLYYKARCTIFGDTRVTCHRYCNDDPSVPMCTDCTALPPSPLW